MNDLNREDNPNKNESEDEQKIDTNQIPPTEQNDQQKMDEISKKEQYQTPVQKNTEAKDSNLVNTVQVRLRELGKPILFAVRNVQVKPGNIVIVEQDKGLDYGMVISDVNEVDPREVKDRIHKIVRCATSDDTDQVEKNKEKIKDVYKVCVRKVQESCLEMKLIEGEYSFDRTKIILYFSAEGRVDFRELVKDLAHIFRVRIELKQIGVRDEAKLIGGCGPCGRELCCVAYLKDFKPVTMRMAKDQNLPLNPSKISGVCGRLLCCLEYEHKFYRKQMKGMPRVGDIVKIKEERSRIVAIDVFNRSVTVQFEDGRQQGVQCEGCSPCKKEKKSNDSGNNQNAKPQSQSNDKRQSQNNEKRHKRHHK